MGDKFGPIFRGPAGPKGPRGSVGGQGPAGPQGEQGPAGVLTPNVVTLEQFGAVGDGTTDDSAAMVAAIAAISVAQGGTILLGTKTYNVMASAPYTLSANTSIVGWGFNSILTSNKNDILIRISNGQNIGLHNLALLGAGMGGAEIGVANAGLTGAQGSRKFSMSNVSITNFAMAGVLSFNQLAFTGTITGNVFDNVRIQQCGIGFWLVDDYITCTGCTATACATGVQVQAGNVLWTGGVLVNNQIGVDLVVSGNDGHGIFAGANINHNNTTVRAITINNGMTFVGCHMFSEGAGGIILTDANGVQFIGCTLDLVKYDIDSSTGVVFRDNQIFGNEASTINNLNGTSALWEGNTRLNGTPFSNQLLSFTFAADANETLTALQSLAGDIIVQDGVISVPRLITSQTTPDLARPIFLRNLNTKDITFAWATGASVSIPTNTSARIASDGTNAVVTLRGT